MSVLFTPLTLRSVTFKHRVFMSPMCQYSATDGVPNDWHRIHLASRAVGGAALVFFEATAVTPEGRISDGDLGLWDDRQIPAYRDLVTLLKQHGAVPGLQLAHAGRKGSTAVPWQGGAALPAGQGWTPLAPSAIAFGKLTHPRSMNEQDLKEVRLAFVNSAQRALAAGFEVLELHAAHGYLLHEFLSPLSNQRQDAWGGDLAHRMRYPLSVVEAVRAVWPEHLPLFVRLSATDWAEGGWDLDQSIAFARELKTRGVDFIDCSSGGLVPHASIPATPGYQVGFAQSIRKAAAVATGAVGLITEATQAQAIIAEGQADAVLLARALLRSPYWVRDAARALGCPLPWPDPYARAG
ncbi:MAG TPA: NADH:flavin oxidoreductase/NADH oxidase [Acidiferrobacteraceae bacterium]|nr:NADH:flavin oxidoreductase/NADH oxidase [Acidiferrobacteraceae bacterium]